MSRNHPYVDLYNQRHIILCCGQGAWEDEMVKSTGLMKETFDRLGVNAWCDFGEAMSTMIGLGGVNNYHIF